MGRSRAHRSPAVDEVAVTWMACAHTRLRTPRTGVRRPLRGRPPSLVRTTLARNGATGVVRDPAVEVLLDTDSEVLVPSAGRVWCVRYHGLGGLFRKDRGPSKALGRALCDEVKERFGCAGFLTTDELPRYGIGRPARRRILAAAGADASDCVVVFAYPEDAATAMDDYLYSRLCAMQ
jgi:Glu-tRNA(Gln) amidotransferase subunit E-like FAD-binding protein